MKIKITALELIMRLADGSTTANTLQHISKIAKATLDEMKDQEEMQPFIDMTNESYLRGVHDGRVAAQRQWVGLTDEEKQSICRTGAVYAPNGVVARTPFQYREELEGVAWRAVRKTEAKLKEKNT
jgi:hypothetical protein